MVWAPWWHEPAEMTAYRYEVVDEWRERRKVAFFWTAIFIVWLAAGSSAFLAAREVLATIHAPRCVIDPASQVWGWPAL